MTFARVKLRIMSDEVVYVTKKGNENLTKQTLTGPDERYDLQAYYRKWG